MSTQQDNGLAIGVESTFKTAVTPTRGIEFLTESLDFNPTRKQGQGLRVGTRVDRSGRRVTPIADAGGDITQEMVSKGMGLMLQAAFGAATSTLVSGSTYQQVFTLGDNPSSLTIQKSLVEVGGTIDALTFLGCMVDSFEMTFANADIASLKATIDAADVSSAPAYTAPSGLYPAEPVNLFHFANAAITTGTLTAPTTTALGVGASATANVRSASVAVGNSLQNNRFNFGGAGRKNKQTRGKRMVTGKMEVEYDSVTYRDLVLNDTAMNLVVTYTGGALSTGLETLQIIVPEIKFNGELPKANGTDLIVQSMDFNGLDNLVAAQPIWAVLRTADTAL